MKNKIFLTAILLSAAMLGGCGHAKSVPAPTAANQRGYDFIAIKNPQKMTHRTFSVYKPSDWQEVKQGMVLYYLPPGSVATDTVAEKIVITAYSMPKNNTTTLAEFMKEDLAANQKDLPGLKFVTSTEPVKVGSLSGREEEYENKIIGKNILITQIDARAGDILYKLQHYCAENYCKADGIFSEMAGSFEAIPQN
jgi:hypothetical protein